MGLACHFAGSVSVCVSCDDTRRRSGFADPEPDDIPYYTIQTDGTGAENEQNRGQV